MQLYSKRQVADRIFMCAIIFLLVLTPYFDEDSVRLFSYYPDLFREAANLLLASLAGVALADTVVNDTFSDKYSIKITMHARQLVWMLIGVSLVGMAFVSIRSYRDYTQAVWVGLFGVRCISIAFLDLRYELARLKEEYPKCATPSAPSTSSP